MNKDFNKLAKNRSKQIYKAQYEGSAGRETLPPIYPPTSSMSNNMTTISSARDSEMYGNQHSGTYSSGMEDGYNTLRREIEAVHMSRLNQIRDDALVDVTPRRGVQKGSHHPL